MPATGARLVEVGADKGAARVFLGVVCGLGAGRAAARRCTAHACVWAVSGQLQAFQPRLGIGGNACLRWRSSLGSGTWPKRHCGIWNLFRQAVGGVGTCRDGSTPRRLFEAKSTKSEDQYMQKMILFMRTETSLRQWLLAVLYLFGTHDHFSDLKVAARGFPGQAECLCLKIAHPFRATVCKGWTIDCSQGMKRDEVSPIALRMDGLPIPSASLDPSAVAVVK
eukprot:6184634-Pleurochrysis_carterae.AAC.2